MALVLKPFPTRGEVATRPLLNIQSALPISRDQAECRSICANRVRGAERRATYSSKNVSMALQTVAIVSVPMSDQECAKKFCVEKLGFTLVADLTDAMGPDASAPQSAHSFVPRATLPRS